MPSAALRPRHSLAPLTRVFLTLCVCLLISSFAFSQVQVVTEHNDVFRDGANPNETVLTPANLNFHTFGKLFTQSVDGYIVGQPLYLPAIPFPDGSTHNVVYVATQHDSVFAFDADNHRAPLWKTSFINPAAGITSVPIGDYGCGGTSFTEIGIVSTPVIDPVAGTLFVLAKTLENGTYMFRLHALSITTGADVVAPAVISASVSTKSGTLQFNPAIQMQRPALLLENGAIYIGFGSNGCDTYAYHGWLLAYDEASLQQVGTFITTPNGTQGAIWQAGGGPAADTDGTIFLATGNGTFDAATGGSDYGDSLLHLSPAISGLTVLDYFTPHDQQTLAANDIDLGSGGVVLLPDLSAPHTHELLGGGKAGTLYVVDRDNMGGYNSLDDSQIVQSIPLASSSELDSVPAYWNGNVYIAGQFDSIKAFSLVNETLSPTPTSKTSITSLVPGSVSVTSNGTNNGILWVLPQNNPAILYAFDPTNLGTVFYTSEQAPSERDHLGSVPKFVAPTIANGKVYIGGSSSLSVYGLLPQISPITGSQQSAYVGTTLPAPLQLRTVDAYQGNPIANVSVTCKDGGVGGIFSAVMPMVTDSQGQASTTYTLPKKAQTITINCTSTGYRTGSFSQVGIAGPVTDAVIVSGNHQTGLVSTQLPAALVMQVLDPYGYGVPGVTVTFSDGGAGGTFSSASVVTNSIGDAKTFYTTPNNPRTVTVTASIAGITPVKFSEVVQTTGFTLSATPSTLSVAQGASVPSTITVNPTGGFSGTVTLTAKGLPSGVTASFNPTSTTGTSTLTLAASSTATTGVATVTITGTSGSLVQTKTIKLTVTVPANFTLSATPGTLSVAQGASVPSAITVNSTGGFSGTVTLTATGLPSGVTASFNPTSTTGTSTLTLAASSTATTGTATVTITGTSGSLVQTTTISLTVTLPPPSYSLSAGTPSPTSVKPGARSTAPITAASANTDAGSVPLFCSLTITGKDANNLTQSNAAPVVSVTVS